jgi:Fe-S-cluster-containing hydrogenase component 2/CRP-like cAMP-binding protein
MSVAATPTEKAAAKPGKKSKAARNLKAPPPAAGMLRKLPLFQDAPASLLADLEKLATGVVLERDALILGGDAPPPDAPTLHFVIAGQVGVAQGQKEEALAAAKKKTKAETFKAVGTTLAVFGAGDFFADDVATLDGGLLVYAITEAQVLTVPARAAANLLNRHPKIAEKMRGQAERWLARLQTLKQSGREDVFDFYVKNGFSFSTRTKIRQLELCIDCDKCVQACEDRHGFARLERFGPQVGLINFSVSCRQCYDPRCLLDCNFDAISRDPVSKEIRIQMENCTGCNVCARNCPNDSIFIYDIPPDFDGGVWETVGKKVPKKTAVKCDRCAGYGDMACVSACPTGSMIDAVPEVLFGLGVSTNLVDACAVEPFEHGLSTQEGGRVFARLAYWVAALVTLACLTEWVFRRWVPELSFLPFYPEDHQLDGGITSGRGLGLAFGVAGFSCLLGTLIYSMRNRLGFLSFIGSKYLWFSLHNALGVLGPALIFLHGNLNFSRWPSIGVYMMTLTVLSGLLGQYIANQIPGKEFAIDKELRELNKSITTLASQWNQHTRAINVLEVFMKEEAQRSQGQEDNMGSAAFIGFLLTSDIRLFARMLKLRFGGLKAIRNKALRKQTVILLKNRMVLERRQRFFGTANRLLNKWKRFHIAFAVLLFIVAFIHVGISLYY